MAERQYWRLTRWRGHRKGWITVALATRSSLWIGEDHLLNIDSNRFVEEYKRFYFRDIQAITIRKTRRREIWNMILLLLLLLCLGGLTDPGFRPLVPLSIGILSVALLVNNILGATCVTYLRTAVQIEELPSLNRIRRAHKILERIRPLIAAAQGELTPEAISLGLQEMNLSAAGSASANRVVTSPLNLS
jgi:hypothetical protein